MRINTQPIEKRQESDRIEIHSIWDTIQGEGPFAGMPATFIRLAGCNLQCQFCDTDYTSRRYSLTASEILEEVRRLPRRRLVVLTGGEPFRQSIELLVEWLTNDKKLVQIETNGTLKPKWYSHPENVTIVCSPKTPLLAKGMWDWVDAVKYVVEAGYIDEDGLPLSSVGPQYGRPARPPEGWKGDIYVQPLDFQDRAENLMNVQAAVESCMTHGYRLCLQVHKLVGLD